MHCELCQVRNFHTCVCNSCACALEFFQTTHQNLQTSKKNDSSVTHSADSAFHRSLLSFHCHPSDSKFCNPVGGWITGFQSQNLQSQTPVFVTHLHSFRDRRGIMLSLSALMSTFVTLCIAKVEMQWIVLEPENFHFTMMCDHKWQCNPQFILVGSNWRRLGLQIYRGFDFCTCGRTLLKGLFKYKTLLQIFTTRSRVALSNFVDTKAPIFFQHNLELHQVACQQRVQMKFCKILLYSFFHGEH